MFLRAFTARDAIESMSSTHISGLALAIRAATFRCSSSLFMPKRAEFLRSNISGFYSIFANQGIYNIRDCMKVVTESVDYESGTEKGLK